jgi:phosphatidylglycerol---prolipoprotein diacylglyceryl transferase
MYPELFHIGGFTMNSFGVMMALAFIAAGIVAHWQFKKRGVKPDFIYPLLIAAVVGGLLGAKIHYLILHPDEWPGNMLSGSGLVWFGGLFGAIIGVVLVTWVSKQKLARIMDAGAIAVALGYAFGRTGCFLRGDDYGVPTDLPWGVSFPQGVPPTPPGVRVHPTQLYEIGATLVIFALLIWVVSPRMKREGSLMFAYAVLAGIERFLVEFIRTNPKVAWGLTSQQWIAVAMFFVGIAGVWWFETHGKPRFVPGQEPVAAVVTAGAAGKARVGAGGAGSSRSSGARAKARPGAKPGSAAAKGKKAK